MFIGEAFVKIRPDLHGFKTETERGVKSSFESLAKTVGLAFGAAEGFKFGKEILSDAADVQKQIELVRTEFGSASKQVTEFAENSDSASTAVQNFAHSSAAALGISAHLAETTAGVFGITFKNLKISQEEAAKMTVNFEKLGGAIGIIRNVDPAAIFSALPAAIRGNLRPLKAMGIALDQHTLQVVALKEHYIHSIQEPLNRTTRALAVYAYATQNLTTFLEQARHHTKDLATQQRILAAEWDNEKDRLGGQLIPLVQKYTTHLVTWLGKTKNQIALQKGLASAMGAVVQIVKAVAHAITVLVGIVKQIDKFTGSFHDTIKDLVIVLIAWKAVTATIGIVSFASNLVKTTKIMLGLVTATEAETAAAKLLKLQLIALGALAAIVITVVVARKIAKNVENLQKREIAAEEAKATAQLQSKLVPHISDEIHAKKAAGETSMQIIKDLHKQLGTSLKADDIIADAFRFSSGSKAQQQMEAYWDKVLVRPAANAVKKMANDTASNVDAAVAALAKTFAPGIAKIQEQLGVLNQNLTVAMAQEQKDIHDVVEQAKGNLASIASTLEGEIDALIDKPLQNAQNKINALQNRKSLNDLRREVVLPGGKALSTDPQKALAQLRALQRQAGNQNKDAIAAFILQYQSAILAVKQDQANVTKETTHRQIDDLTAHFNRNEIGVKAYRKRILAILKHDHINFKDAGRLLGYAFVKGLEDTTGGLFGQAAAIAKGPQRPGVTGSNPTIIKPMDTLIKDQRDIKKIQRQIGDKQIALQTRIAKATEKEAQLRAELNAVVLADDRKSTTKNKGHGRDRTVAVNGPYHGGHNA